MAVDLVGFWTFQSPIQLAAALNLALTASSTIRGFAEHRYDDERASIEGWLETAIRVLKEGNDQAREHGSISETRLKMNRVLLAGTVRFRELRDKQRKSVARLKRRAARVDSGLFWISSAFAFFSIVLLFMSSQSPLQANISEQEARALNDRLWWAYGAGCSVLYLPTVMAFTAGIAARREFKRHSDELKAERNALQSEILEI